MNNSPVKIWRNQSEIRKMLGKTGKIISFTIIRIPPNGHSQQAPYPVVLVQLRGKRLVAQLVDYETSDLAIGQKVSVVLRRIKSPGKEGIIPYGVKFKPLKI